MKSASKSVSKVVIPSLLLLLSLGAHASKAVGTGWSSLERSKQAEVLQDLEYLRAEELPEGSKVISFVSGSEDFDLKKVTDQSFRSYIQKVFSEFDSQVSREDIEQSEYQTDGDEKTVGLYLLVSKTGEILGALLQKYQNGRDGEDEDGDINWSASVRFDANGDVFSDESGQPFDDLYFEWSGH